MSARLPILVSIVAALTGASLSCGPRTDPRLSGSSRGQMAGGWIPIRLQGSPAQIGFQHGYLLASEIKDALAVMRLMLPHDTRRDWAELRRLADTVFWPRVDEEYRQELAGMVAGMAARGIRADVLDLVVLNANLEVGYYTRWLDRTKAPAAPERCSAFVATGSWTRGGKPVIGHNNWSGYLEGSRWNVVFDVRPEKGHRMIMDGFPGLIHSGDDFGVTSAGLVITETTISHFAGFDPTGIPEFVRARKAMQYAGSIDEFAATMREGNNGGYANTWLVADMPRSEIGRLELGLKHVTLDRTSDGYFVGANFPIDPRLTTEETDFKADPATEGTLVRRARWEQLMAEGKGRIDVAAGKLFLADHYDAYEKKADSPSERTLCGHVDLSPRGMKPWQEEFGPAGTVQAKVTDAAMAGRMEIEAAVGHPCGRAFVAAEHLKRYAQFGWQKDLLRDLPSGPWTRFAAP
jgi:hypothetical protein